ncbi:pilus assembly protein TadG-related protein [Streptomyces sp. TRM70308]|uniref:pilus assembly protein TadG-related protein n=1 Tax=Streptomyces sp. TRM70308 TaxID=3131932 RepID=UPI003CFF40DC
MTVGGARRDSGQAFPLYITVVAGILFLAFAYFAVGQAAAMRNAAQGAADAAALAAAHEARRQAGEQLVSPAFDPKSLVDVLRARSFLPGAVCDEADRFADRNRAEVRQCQTSAWPVPEFSVEVRSRDSVGSSVVPGTEGKYATASATALIRPLCEVPRGDDAEEDDAEDGTSQDIIVLCEGRELVIDPVDPDSFPDLDRLFAVRLVD